MSDALTKFNATDLAALLPRVALPPEPALVIRDCTTVPAAITALESGGFDLEATRLIAHALPKREAVWWACMCALHTAPPDLPEPDRAAREAAELWPGNPPIRSAAPRWSALRPPDSARQRPGLRSRRSGAASPWPRKGSHRSLPHRI